MRFVFFSMMQYFSADGGVVVGALVDASAFIGPHKMIKKIRKSKTKKKMKQLGLLVTPLIEITMM